MTDKTSWTLPLVAVALLLLGGAGALWLAEEDGVDPVVESRDTKLREGDAKGDTDKDQEGTDTGPARAELAAPEKPDATPSSAKHGSLRIQVVWHDGTPAANVGLHCQGAWPARLLGGTQRQISNQKGIAVFADMPVMKMSLRSDHGGSVKAEVVAGQETPVRFEVPQGVDVHGVVVDPRGTPVRDANIWLTTSYTSWLGGRVMTRSGAGGKFVIRSMPKDMSLGAIAQGYLRSKLVDLDTLDTKKSPVMVRLELRPEGCTVDVTVVDPDQSPVPGALVAIGKIPRGWTPRPGGGQVEFWTPYVLVTDVKGQVHLHGVPAGKHPLNVRAEGYPIWKMDIECKANPEQQVMRQEVVVYLQRPVTITGVVKDGDLKPIAKAIVRGVPEAFDQQFLQSGQFDYKGVFGYPVTQSGADGSYRLEGVAPGEVHLFAMRGGRGKGGEARERAATILSAIPGAALRWDAVISAGNTITGIVSFRDAKPMPGVFVTARETKTEKRHVITTGKDGRFRFVNLSACSHTVSVQLWSPPKGTPPLIQHDVWPDRGDLRFVTTFDAPIKHKRGVVSGHLQDVAHRLEGPGKLSFALTSDKRWWMSRPKIDGNKFRFTRVKPGRFRVTAKRGDSVIAIGQWFVLAPGEERDIGALRTTPAGSVLIRLDRGAGTEQVEPTLWFNPKSVMHGQSIKLGKKNEGLMRELPVGVHNYTMRSPGVVTQKGEVTVQAGRQAEIVVVMIAAVNRKIEIRWPKGDNTRLNASITDRQGKEYWSIQEFDTRSATSLQRKWTRLPLGSYILGGETVGGAKGTIQFEMKSLEPDQPTVVLELR